VTPIDETEDCFIKQR